MKFSEIYTGQKAEIQHKITEKDIEKFVDLTGDDNRLHIDKDYAKTTNFKKPVAHGMIGASFISTIIGTKLPGDGALWFSQNLEFLLPVRIGDLIVVKAEVVNILKRQNIIELRTDIFNQHKQKVIAGTAKVKIVEQVISEKEEKENISKKTALIIGASGGIGSAIAIKLVKEGYDLALHYYSNKEAVSELKSKIQNKGIKVEIFQADITNKGDVSNLIKSINRKFNGITSIIFAATIDVPSLNFNKLEWDDFQKHININIKSVFYLIKEASLKLEKSTLRRIIAITTQYTESTPPNDMIHYVTAKSAMNGFFKSLAIEFAPNKTTVNLVSPSMTETELIANVPEKHKLILAAKTPLKRLAKPEDIANTVSFLISDEANFITGQTIRVNGGMNML